MRRLVPVTVAALALIVFAGCSPQNEPWVYKNDYLQEERTRSTTEVADLRNRMTGQAQR